MDVTDVMDETVTLSTTGTSIYFSSASITTTPAALTMTFGLSDYASIALAEGDDGVFNDMGDTVAYDVTAQDGVTTKRWVITWIPLPPLP